MLSVGMVMTMMFCCLHEVKSLSTVIVTFVDDLPVNVGNGTDASAPTPEVAPHDIPGVTLIANLPFLGEAIYRGTTEEQDADDLCDIIMSYQNIETCEPDTGTVLDQSIPDATPNDPDYLAQTYLNTTNTISLWQQGLFGNRNVKIGIIDTGVDLQNPDIFPSLWTNPSTNDNSAVPNDLHCASFLNGVASGNCSDGNGVSHALVIC